MSYIFPDFKHLEKQDKALVDHFVNKYLPYSDFNFDSLWSYNTENKVLICVLNENLVVQFQDYITKEPFLSFIGTNKVEETIDTLLNYSKDHGLEQSLKLIPEIVLYHGRNKLQKKYDIKEDEDGFDYIYLTDKLIELSGNDYRGKRNFVNRFKKHYPNHSYHLLDLTDKTVQNNILNLFLIWEKNTEKNRDETENEMIAIKRILDFAESPSIVALGIYVENEMIAFSINEVTSHQFGVIHFEKANTEYEGSYQFLKQATAIELKRKGCMFINYEQDLGIENLRKAKKSWHPIGYLKKFNISPRKHLYSSTTTAPIYTPQQ